MKRILFSVATLVALSGIAVLAMAQDDDQPMFEERERPELVAGESALRDALPSALPLGADQGTACICLCREAVEPPPTGETADEEPLEEWAYFERSIVSGCQWSGRLCVVSGRLGLVGACAVGPGHLQ